MSEGDQCVSPVRVFCLGTRLLSLRSRDLALDTKGDTVCAWNAKASGVASNLQESSALVTDSETRSMVGGERIVLFAHDKSVVTLAWDLSITGGEIDVGTHTSQAREARCLHLEVSDGTPRDRVCVCVDRRTF